MSAVGGVIYFQPKEVPIIEFLQPIMNKMPHRGKIDEGFVFLDGETATQHYGTDTPESIIREQDLLPLDNAPSEAWLGFGARLSAQVSKSGQPRHQPLKHHSGRAWIVFDGEILNAKSLADELREEGVALEGQDDAEILLQAYLSWKERVLSKLEGSYAFVIVDLDEKRIFGARDRFGTRPFYYVADSKLFAFASEAKSLIQLPFVSKKVSKSAVYDYLVLGISESSTQSMFRGITELPPGSAFSMLIETGNMKVWGYFHLTTDSKLDRYSRNKVSTLSYRLKKSLINNISQHLTPGFKSAYHLDSSLESLIFPYLLKEFIEELPAKERPKPSEIYMGIFGHVEISENGSYHDLEQAKATVKELEVDMLQSLCRFEDFIENLEKITYYQDVPFSTLDVFGQYKMLETAKEAGIDLVLENFGSEQLFSSSHSHYNQYLHDLWQKGEYKILMDNFLGSSDGLITKIGQIKELTRSVIFRSTSDDLKETFIKASSDEFSYLKTSFTDRYFRNLDDKIKTSPLNLNQLLASELSGPVIKEKLRTTDRNSFLTGVAVRCPFVSDREMAESMVKASSVYKIRGGVSGNILRKAMRGILPDQVMKMRRRHLDPSSNNKWLRQAREELKEYVTTDLDDFLDSRKIKKDWDHLVDQADKNQNAFLWRVINLAIWRYVYFNS